MEVLTLTSLSLHLGTLAGLAHNYFKLRKDLKHDISDHVDDMMDKKVILLQEKIKALTSECARLEILLEREVAHLKENHDSKIDNLANQVDKLREEVRQGQSQLVNLLTQMVGER